MKKGTLGNTVRRKRIELGYSQEELAELIDITPTHLKHLESEHRKPSIEVLVKLMEILHFSFDSIVFPLADNSELKELSIMLSSCTSQELKIIHDLTNSLQKNR